MYYIDIMKNRIFQVTNLIFKPAEANRPAFDERTRNFFLSFHPAFVSIAKMFMYG